MQHSIFETNENYSVALLVKAPAFNRQRMEEHYVDGLVTRGVPKKEIIAFTIEYNESNKAPAGFIKEYLNKLLKALDSLGIKILYVTDSAYFKVLTNQRKADPHIGYALPCFIKGYEHMSVVLGINHQQIFYNPEIKERLDYTLEALASKYLDTYVEPGKRIIHSTHYPQSLEEIKDALHQLHQYPSLACDIETFSLLFTEAGIGTIAFAWDQHNGIAFACDYTDKASVSPIPCAEIMLTPGKKESNPAVRKLLCNFFETYQGNLKFHRGTFDIKCLIYALWMKDALDTEGLLTGLEILTRNVDDTLLIAYLATNTTAGNQLGLKFLSQEFAGNYAVEVKDISKVPLSALLEYNLVDTLCTNYVYEKYYPIMVQDQQEELYKGLFLDSLKLIIQLELTGMPMSRKRIQGVKAELEQLQKKSLETIFNSPVVGMATLLFQEKAWDADYFGRRDKAKNPDKIKRKLREAFDDLKLNPNSGPQLQVLLYEHMGLPVIDTTDTGAPATGADTIEKLINHTEDPAHKELLKALIEFGKVNKILSTFIPAFENAVGKDSSDTVWLHGSFNLGGTVSGRLSSSDPNLQNIPANSTFGDLVKSCFVAPKEWIFAGADFNSLEDYVSALTTKDPAKLDVYIKGFDGHCFRAANYYRDQLMYIDLEDPKSVNSIKDTHPELRQDSKAPTFALTYQGTHYTLMNNLGWSKEKAIKIETAYHEMYKVSDQYVQDKLKQASLDGYVTVAFGLRVRTPMLKQVIWGAPRMPKEAAAEGRTAGNALGQSYGLLNNRAAVAFFKKVWNSPYRTKILPVALIHDAIYILIADEVEVVEWANKNLIDEMKWQELPELEHPTVKLGANLDIFWPSWENGITLPNDASAEEIRTLCNDAIQKENNSRQRQIILA